MRIGISKQRPSPRMIFVGRPEVLVDRDDRLERLADPDQKSDDERERLEVAEGAAREEEEDPGEQERPDPAALVTCRARAPRRARPARGVTGDARITPGEHSDPEVEDEGLGERRVREVLPGRETPFGPAPRAGRRGPAPSTSTRGNRRRARSAKRSRRRRSSSRCSKNPIRGSSSVVRLRRSRLRRAPGGTAQAGSIGVGGSVFGGLGGGLRADDGPRGRPISAAVWTSVVTEVTSVLGLLDLLLDRLLEVIGGFLELGEALPERLPDLRKLLADRRR